jgi:hypothetical protein
MAYTFKNSRGVTYYLHTKKALLRGGERQIYYFSKEQKENATDQIPDGYEIKESERTGLPVLKKSG